MLNTRATLRTSSTHAPQSTSTPSEIASPSGTATPSPAWPADDPQVRRSSHTGTAPRAQLPTPSRASAPAAPSAGTGDLWPRLSAMKEHLALLQAHHATGRELPQPLEGKFLDLLVAAENARNPSLNLSFQSIDIAAVRSNPANALETVSGLGDALVRGMLRGEDWRAVLKIDDHHVAVEARHHPKHPSRVSVAVVDSVGSDIKNTEWLHIAEALREHANRALKREGKVPDAQVWLNTLNTSTLQTATSSGSDIFALAAARKMPADANLMVLHKRVMTQQRRSEAPTAVRVINDNSVGGAQLFKLMTRPQAMEELLGARPELKQAAVNKKGQTLAAYQAAHTELRTPPFGMPHRYNTAHEEKRLRMYERAIEHIESRLAPQLDAMKAHLDDLRLAGNGEARRPAARDGQFIGMLMHAENAQDPSLRLSAHRLDTAGLLAGDPAATESLWGSIAEGMRTGNDWRATLDVDGHHVALDARHDADNPSHVSLVVMVDAGLQMQLQDWKPVVEQLLDRMCAQPAGADGAAAAGKLWLTHLSVSAQQPHDDSALFALMAARGMAGDKEIARVHTEALTQANSVTAPAGLRGRSGDHLLDPDLPTHGGNLLATPDLMSTSIEMYEQAVGHHELILAAEA